jgi:hypothetical protein
VFILAKKGKKSQEPEVLEYRISSRLSCQGLRALALQSMEYGVRNRGDWSPLFKYRENEVYVVHEQKIRISEKMLLTSANVFLQIFFGGDFSFFSYYVQHCFICRPSDYTVPSDAVIELRTIATGALAVRCSNY